MSHLLTSLCVFLLVPCAQADEKEKAEAVKMVDQAIAMYKADGFDKTLKEINDPKGKFSKGELYVFVYDENMKVLGHPHNKKLIGNNVLDVPDVAGKMYRREIQEKAKKDGTGWVDYKYKNFNKKDAIEDKTTYLKKVDNYIFCAGVYK